MIKFVSKFKIIILAIVMWTATAGLSYVWNLQNIQEQTISLAEVEARSSLKQDLAFRIWSTNHGGVYLRVNKNTQPSPYLAHIPNRDVPIPGGGMLTLQNPAASLREIKETQGELYGDLARITGLKYLNPINAPDNWEKKALGIIEVTREPYSDITVINDKKYMRVMQPMIMEENCMKCHAWTGIKVGGVRGATDIAIPLERYEAAATQTKLAISATHGGIYIFGLVLILLIFRQIRLKESYSQELQATTSNLRIAAATFDSHEGILITDADSKIIRVNRKFTEVTGFSTEDAIGKTPRILRSGRHDEKFYAAMWQEILSKGSWSGEIWDRHKNGSVYPLEMTITAVKNDRGETTQYVAIYNDIAQRKQAEQELDQHRQHLEELVQVRTAELTAARDDAESASHAKSEFLASMSHELRTPLNAVLGYAQLLESDNNLPEGAKESIKEIEGAGRHLLALINDLIDLARIEAGKIELSLEPVSVKSILSDSLAMVAQISSPKGLELINTCDISEEIAVFADHVRLRQVLINLLSNAIKYNTPQGTVHLSCSVIDEKILISVADTGLGIPADKQPRVFNAFDRLGEERGMIEGTGIGLVITKRMVEAMGGKIGFESKEGQGSTFWVEFAVCAKLPLPVTRETAQDKTPASLSPPTAHTVILYIEDNLANLRLMEQICLRIKGLEIRHAHTAELGIELARAAPPALILMDINLPGISGYAALNILRSTPETAHIPVIAVSANAMTGDKDRGLVAGFDAYVTKPINVQNLLDTLNRLINKAAN